MEDLLLLCGDGEYIIYTALAWRNKSFGNAIEFVWATDSNEYAILDQNYQIRLFKHFKETEVKLNTPMNIDKINGGTLLSIQSPGLLSFYSWDNGDCIRCMEINAKNVYWSESDLVVIVGDEFFYILRYNRMAYQKALEENIQISSEGLEDAFEVLSEVNESVKCGFWVGDSFVYINSSNRLNFTVGNQTNTLAYFDQNMYLLGYIPKDNRIYLSDKDINIYSYSLPQSVIEFETAILREDFDTAKVILPTIPSDQLNKIARFLESQKLYEMALSVSTDPEHKFSLSIQLQKLDVAYEIAKELDDISSWKQLSEEALNSWKFDLAEQCFKNAKDYEGLLMMYQASGNISGILELAAVTEKDGKNNIAFLCYLLANDTKKCIELLIKTDRINEAVLFAYTYMPSAVPELTQMWKASLNNPKVAESITDPIQNPELFPDYKISLMAESAFQVQNQPENKFKSTDYMKYKGSLDWNIIEGMKIKMQEVQQQQQQESKPVETPVETPSAPPAEAMETPVEPEQQ